MENKTKKSQRNRRKKARLKDDIFISYRVKSREFKAIAKNISEGGMMFESEIKIPVGMELQFEVYQPSNSFKTLIFVIPASIKVMWKEKIKYGFLEEGENEYRIGVSFIKIRGEDKERIAKYVEKNLKIK